jgi:hypothetical protein
MGFTTADITAVRALPVFLARGADGRNFAEPGFTELAFESVAEGKHHQAYLDGRLAGATLSADDRSLIVPVSEQAASVVEIIAVDPNDRLADFSDQLTGYADAAGSRVELSWCGGRYLDDALDHFDVYGGPAGSIDYAVPLNAEPIGATVDGENLGGFGRGGFGCGGLGRSAMAFRFVTAKLAPGTWSFEIVAVDSSGNATGCPAARIDATIAAPPRPPTDFALSSYDPATRTATLTWTPSPDVTGV